MHDGHVCVTATYIRVHNFLLVEAAHHTHITNTGFEYEFHLQLKQLPYTDNKPKQYQSVNVTQNLP